VTAIGTVIRSTPELENGPAPTFRIAFAPIEELSSVNVLPPLALIVTFLNVPKSISPTVMKAVLTTTSWAEAYEPVNCAMSPTTSGNDPTGPPVQFAASAHPLDEAPVHWYVLGTIRSSSCS